MLELLWLLLPIAAASGWWMAQRRASARAVAQAGGDEYFRGLNYLLDDKPDQAIEVFSRMADIDRQTAETHLVLGNLFRRRGEVDRAIRIHGDLLQRAGLTRRQRERVMRELGEDYLRAGLYDRAETLFRDLIQSSEHTVVVLERLIDIFVREKDWLQAIVHCDLLERAAGISKRIEAAHFLCECAEHAASRASQPAYEQAYEFLRQALERDPACVRASMLQGHLAQQTGQWQIAIHAYRQVASQNPAFFPEVITPLKQCYLRSEGSSAWLAYLRNMQPVLYSGQLGAALADALWEYCGVEQALQFLEQELRRQPTFLGLRAYIKLKKTQGSSAGLQPELEILYETGRRMLSADAAYRCRSCGFSGKVLHWECPSCRKWNMIEPLPDLPPSQQLWAQP